MTTVHLKLYHLRGHHALPCYIPDCDESERIEALIAAFGKALERVEDPSQIVDHINKTSGLDWAGMVATVGSSTFLVAYGRHGNIILEGLVLKLDTLKKKAAFILAKMGQDENSLPKLLRSCVTEVKEFLKRQ